MKIIKNAIEANLFEKIKAAVEDIYFPWYYSTTAYEVENNELYNYSFSHTLFCDGEIKSKAHPIVYAGVMQGLAMNGEQVNELIRIRAGLVGITAEQFVHEAHVDFEYPHKTALLYLNESDGPTTFYDQIYDPETKVDPRYSFKEYTVNTRIDPEPNKMVIFNGLTYHASSTPTKVPRRLVINVNYV